MLEKIKVYLLYKNYSNLITRKFTRKNTDNMSQTQLFKYFLQLKNYYNYSKTCYLLRIKYKNLYIKKQDQDINHDIAIDIVNQYNNDVFNTMKTIQTLLKPKIEYNHTITNIFNLLDNQVLYDSESNNENETFVKSKKKSPKKKSKKKSIKNNDSQILKDLEDDKYLNDLVIKQQNVNIDVYIILAKKLDEYSLTYNEHELYFLNQEICLRYFNNTFSMLFYTDKEILIEHITKITKYKFVEYMISIRTRFNIKFFNNIEDIICIKIKLGGIGGVGEFSLSIDQTHKIINLLNALMIQITYRIPSFLELMGDNYPVFSLQHNYIDKQYLLNPEDYIKDKIIDNQTIYLHTYCRCCYQFNIDIFDYTFK